MEEYLEQLENSPLTKLASLDYGSIFKIVLIVVVVALVIYMILHFISLKIQSKMFAKEVINELKKNNMLVSNNIQESNINNLQQ